MYSGETKPWLAATTRKREMQSVLTNAVDMEKELEAIFHLVVQNSNDGALKDQVVSLGLVDAIVETIKRHACSPQFLHRALGLFNFLAKSSQERAGFIVDHGGLDCSFDVMQSWPSFGFLLTTCMLFHITLLTSVAEDTRPWIVQGIFESAVQVMEHNEHDSKLYYHACCVLGMCSGPGVCVTDMELYHRAVQCTFNGVLLFKNNVEAQFVGRNLLIHLCGPEVARQLILHAEIHQCEMKTAAARHEGCP